VLSFILQQNNSEFQKKLVDSGLFTNVSLGYYTQDHTGPITAFAQTTADKFEEAQKALFEQLDKLSDPDYFTDEQIEYAKTQLEISEMYGQEQASTFIHTLGFWWSVAGGINYYLNYVDNLKQVNRTDIENYVKTYIQNKPFIKGILVSPEDKVKIGLTTDIPKDGKEKSL
jgi:zinc protease